ncbi:MAG TPA: hypothetical protein VEG44_03470 [Candidatus Acidoferrales bacterium]|nr:hypothetical protein [Candidatus Acidoferrales bacterium]
MTIRSMKDDMTRSMKRDAASTLEVSKEIKNGTKHNQDCSGQHQRHPEILGGTSPPQPCLVGDHD